MYKARPQLILSICIIATLGIALLKLYYPPLLYFDGGLVLVILLTILLKKNSYTQIFGFSAVVVILGSLIPLTEVIRREVIIQQFLASIVAILAIFLALHLKKLYRSIEEQRVQMNTLLVQKAQFDKINSDVRKLNVELENKISERTMILREALSELERSQMELNKALNEEKELNEIKSRFVSMASHEFRTPLSTILSSAALLLKYSRAEENLSREKHIFRIRDSVKHMTDLLEDFLSLGKLEEGKVFREVVIFEVKEFLQDVVEELEASLKPGQHIILSIQGEPSFATDKRLLKNVLVNLLNNAVKFSAIDQLIDVRVSNTGNKMILEIKDDGIGIPIEDMPHLFSTFYRGKNAINIHGTGLGLHIVKRYIDIMEGDITLSSQLNEGTVFNIGLPNLNEQN